MRVLVGDVGGTNCRFAIAARGRGANAFSLTHIVRYRNDEFEDFGEVLAAYLKRVDEPEAALFAVAGPIEDNAARLTNRGWRIDGWDIAHAFDFARVVVRNDFEAMARGAPELPPASFREIRSGRSLPGAPILVAGPGTGFGLALLAPDPPRWRVIGGEGGHQSYAAQTPFEWEVARVLAASGHVSVERVCGGAFYAEVVSAVRTVLGAAQGDIPAPVDLIIAARAGDAVALAVCRLRASAIMDACANGVLAGGARGGCVIAGGVAERLGDFLVEPDMLARFDAHGPMTDYLSAIPIRLLIDPDAPLFGAAGLYGDLSPSA